MKPEPKLCFFDTETCGFHGPALLIQYAYGVDGPVQLHSVFTTPIWETLLLIEEMMEHTVVAFNLAFDQFHLCQTYTTLSLLGNKVGMNELPEDHITDYALLEPDARLGLCLKPAGALDLMLHARKGPYQSTMDRSDVRIRRVPTALASRLAVELGRRIPLKDVYFARFKDPSRRWQVFDIKDDLDEVIPDFKDVVLRFKPSSALKALANDALGIDSEKIRLFADITLPKKAMPVENGWAPFALSVGDSSDWKGAWPEKITSHISHWGYNTLAREYATDDVIYLQKLYTFFGCPEPNDDDSVLAASVAAVRWRGFAVDRVGLKILRKAKVAERDALGYSPSNYRIVRQQLEAQLSPIEVAVLRDGSGNVSTKGIILEEIAAWKVSTLCEACHGLVECSECEDGLIKTDKMHPAAVVAQGVLDARRAAKRVELIDKLLIAGRFHASVKVIGTLTTRMAGADGMNPQGIPHDKVFRRLFSLADGGLVLCGGDFSGFEICLMDAAYNDPVLRAKLVERRECHVCRGKDLHCKECNGTGETDTKIHALFGTYLFKSEGLTYDDILATKGLPGEKDKYDRSKKGVYATAYGGESYTLQTRVGISEEDADAAFALWCKEHKVWGQERKKIFDMFCSMRQPDGLGTKVVWCEPSDFIESMFGFRRYFTLENTICRTLFQLAEDPPKTWLKLKVNVTRRDRVQTATGATRSALFGAAFQIQAANMRAAANHVIQSSGAQVCKKLQAQIWSLQPSGAQPWVVQPLNIHDEIMVPTTCSQEIETLVARFIVWLKTKVPLAEIDWGSNLKSWAEK